MEFPKKLYITRTVEHEGTDDETTYFSASEDVDLAFDSLQEIGDPVAIYKLVEVGWAERNTEFKRSKK